MLTRASGDAGFLITSDWQTEFSNLDLCEQSLEELLSIAAKSKPDAILHLGDLKEQYNPIDIRVAKFWVKATRRIVDAGYKFIVMAGNHDRISQSKDSKNWLDIVRAAGAITVSRPTVKEIAGVRLAFLPYVIDKQVEVEWAEDLARSVAPVASGKPALLLFHTEVTGALMGGGIQARGNTVEALRMEEYTGCFGGHLHLHQLVENNVWYVGSPFCQDWGEANQRKGHIEVRVSGSNWKDVTVIRHTTKIPHWYDQEYLEAQGIRPEPGAYIRSRVQVTSKKISQQTQAEEQRLEKLYPEARLFVVPRIRAPEKLDVELSGSSDRDNVESYVAATLQEVSRFTAGQVVAYMVSKLSATQPTGSYRELRFILARGRNVLSYKQLEIRYAKQGLVLLRGENQDWPKRSNGSGKTNALSLLPLVLFGETFKKQRNDQWAREQAKGAGSEGYLLFKDGRGRKIEIRRERPHKIYMWVDDKDVSSGITGKGRNGETQGQIEELTGLDMRTFTNSVYIDQTIANGFLFGGQKDRMDLVGKLLDLRRFDVAVKAVGKDATENQKSVANHKHILEDLEAERESLEQDLAELQLPPDSQKWAAAAKSARKEVKRLLELRAALAGQESTYQELQRDLDEITNTEKGELSKLEQARVESAYWRKEIATSQSLIDKGKCPVCRRPSEKTGVTRLEASQGQLSVAMQSEEIWKKAASSTALDRKKLEKRISAYREQQEDAGRELVAARMVLTQAQEAEAEEGERNKAALTKINSVKTRLSLVRRGIRAARVTLKELDVQAELLDFAQKAFHRSGMPIYLAAAMCPKLNSYAEEYADIFSQGKIKIQFSVTDREFCADIVNLSGSQKANGQSVGEAATAGVITAFALREAAPRTNLLILDEPGHGLDPEGAKQFAQGLLKLKSKFETIIVTTHSPIIESILSGETTWVAVKRHSVSKLLTQ